MPTVLTGYLGVTIDGTDAGTRLNPDYPWYDATLPDLSPAAITGPPAIEPVGSGSDPTLLQWQESGFPFGSEQSKLTPSVDVVPGILVVQKEVREEDPPGFNPWPVGVLAEWGWAGVPLEVGVFPISVAASSHAGSAGYPGGDFEWHIALLPSCPLITLGDLDPAYHAIPYTLAIETDLGTAPFTWDVADGALPPGLSLSAGGTLSGTPTTLGTYTFILRATDADGCPGVRRYTVVIDDPPPVVVHPDTLGPLKRDVAPRPALLVTATGGIGPPYTFAITDGDLPPGLTLETDGRITGVPTTAGSFDVTIEATDAASETGDRDYTIVVTGLRVLISDGPSGEPMIDVTRELEAADLELVLSRASSATFVIGDGYIPERGADVLVYARDGVTPIFSGVVMTRRVTGMTASHPANKIAVECLDYSLYFDDATVTLVYTTTQDLEDVIADIVDQALAAYGITYTPTATGKTVPPIEWIEITVTEAFKRISDATTAVFRVIPISSSVTKELVVFGPLAFPAPWGIADFDDPEEGYINPFDIEWVDGPTLTPNTVDLLCGPTGSGVATQNWIVGVGETSWEVDIQAVLGEASAARAAYAFLGTTANFTAGETVTLGSSTYTFRAVLVGDVAGDVLIGATAEDSLNNLIAAIMNAGGSGYAPSTPVNADASAYLRLPDQLAAEALTVGAAGNAIAVASTAADAFWYGEGTIATATLTRGADASGAAGWTSGFVLEGARVAQSVGPPGSGAYYEWDVTAGRGTLSIGSGSPPPVGTALELQYLAVFPFHAIYSDGAPQQTYRETHPEIVNYQAGVNLAHAIYTRQNVPRFDVDIFTDVDGFFPGQEIDIDISRRGAILGIFLIASVHVHLVNADLWEYRLATQQSLGAYAGSYVEQWKALTSGSSSSSSTAPATLPDGGAAVAGDVYTDGRKAFVADQALGGHRLTGVADPIDDQDAATKAYVDTAAPGSGDVTGPASSIDGEAALFDGTTGKLLKRATGTGVVHRASGVDSASAVVEADLSLADNTTANVSTAAHGFAPKAPNDATKFLNGANPPAWAVPPGSVVSALAGANVATSETQASNTAYGDLATAGPAVTLTTGATVIVMMSAVALKGSSGNSALISVAVSGATTLAAADANGTATSSYAASHNLPLARVLYLTGLTPGVNTFTLKYRNDGGGTWTFFNRSIAVIAL